MVRAENCSERRIAGNIRTLPLILTGVTTLQKAMLRANAFLPSETRDASASLVMSVVPARTLRLPTAGIGTELLARREKIEVTRSAHRFERSPVPMGRPHRHYTRAVCALPRRMPQT
jgi:hypothetical protein